MAGRGLERRKERGLCCRDALLKGSEERESRSSESFQCSRVDKGRTHAKISVPSRSSSFADSSFPKLHSSAFFHFESP